MWGQKMKKLIYLIIFGLLSSNILLAQLIPVDLNTWSQQGLLANGNWVIADDNSYIDQTVNGEPTFFVAPDAFINSTIRGTISVRTTSDNDFIGFVFGYQQPQGEGDYFDFYLFDWKQETQTVSGTAKEGFTLSRVQGAFKAANASQTGYWNHTDSIFQVMDTRYGTQYGWLDNQEYLFELTYETDRILITIDADTIFDVSGEFSSGQFGFYNYSQQAVRYQEITQNHFPIAQNDSVSTPFGIGVNISILENDSDVDGAFSLDHINQPANGIASILDNNIISYIPNDAFTGVDSFNYVIIDPYDTRDSAFVYITVGPNLQPVAQNDSAATSFGIAINTNILENDSDPDNAFSVDHLNQPQNGIAVMLNDSIARYTPNDAFAGVDSFSYAIIDAYNATDSAFVYITVGPDLPPIAVNDFSITPFGISVNINILGNDSDPDNAFSVDHINQPQYGIAAMLNDSLARYTPNSTFAGADSFSYVIIDAYGATDSAFVFITVGPDLPPIAQNDSIFTAFKSAIIFDVLKNDNDPEGKPLMIVSVSDPDHGTAVIMKADSGQQIEYMPDSTFSGQDSFKYVINDLKGQKDSAMVFVTVETVNNLNDQNFTPVAFALKQNFPNPFNPQTTIGYHLAKNSRVTLKVFDIRGREVATLLDKYQSVGIYNTLFNSAGLSSGVYFYTIKTNAGFSQTKK